MRKIKLTNLRRLFPFWKSLREGMGVLIRAGKAGSSAFFLLPGAGEFLSLKKHAGPSFVR